MGIELRATRYLRKNNERLARFLVEDLRYLDFKETLRWYRSVGPALDKEGRALLGCNDRFFLTTALLRRVDAINPWLFLRCREIESDTDGHLDLWARYHYKSTFGTFAGIIQEVLVNPEIKVAILSHTKPLAHAFLSQIKEEFEINEALVKIYDDVLYASPKTDSPKWGLTRGIVVKRRGNPKEATIEGHGLVDGQPTSRHYDLLNYDDVVTEKSVTTPEMVQKTTRGWEMSDNLGTHTGTRKWHWGTRYSFGDTYGVLLERGALKPRIHPATDDGKLTGKPVFLSDKKWAEIKVAQHSTIAAQMLLNPLAGSEAMFNIHWFKTFDVRPTILNIYIICDPSGGRSNKSDRTAIAVIGIDVGGNKYFLEGVRHRMKLSERYRFIKEYHKKWTNEPGVQNVNVGYEKYGMQSDLEVIEEWMQKDKYQFAIQEVNWPKEGPHAKKARVGRIEPDMKAGRWLFPAIVHRPDILSSKGPCFWKPKENEDKIEYWPALGATKAQRAAEAIGHHYRVVRPLKQLDEDRNIYDVTCALIEEAMFFPFAPKDDLIDVVSRLYDMEPVAPIQFEQEAADLTVYSDA